MKETAKKIRETLKIKGIKGVSVICKPNYTIQVKSKEPIESLKSIVEEVYYSEPHSWLCISVNNHWLQMQALRNINI